MLERSDVKTQLGIIRNVSRRTFNNRVWGAGVAVFDPELENVLLLESRHNRVHEFPGGGLDLISRTIERMTRRFEDNRGVYSVPSMRNTAENELKEETGITKAKLVERVALVATYHGQNPRDTYTVFGAIASRHIPVEELTLQESEINTKNGPGALWLPRTDVAEIGPVHFALSQGAIDDAYTILYDRLGTAP